MHCIWNMCECREGKKEIIFFSLASSYNWGQFIVHFPLDFFSLQDCIITSKSFYYEEWHNHSKQRCHSIICLFYQAVIQVILIAFEKKSSLSRWLYLFLYMFFYFSTPMMILQQSKAYWIYSMCSHISMFTTTTHTCTQRNVINKENTLSNPRLN